MSATDDLCYLSASALATRLRARKVSPVEVVDALADRIKRLNPKLNAYVTLDLENARKDAQMKDKRQRRSSTGTWKAWPPNAWLTPANARPLPQRRQRSREIARADGSNSSRSLNGRRNGLGGFHNKKGPVRIKPTTG